MTTDPGPGRAGHEHDRDYVDKDVAGTEPVQREGDYADKDVAPDEPTAEREGEYTDSDVDAGEEVVIWEDSVDAKDEDGGAESTTKPEQDGAVVEERKSSEVEDVVTA